MSSTQHILLGAITFIPENHMTIFILDKEGI
jgi:hypothetical protein